MRLDADDKRVVAVTAGTIVVGVALFLAGGALFGVRYTYSVRVVAVGGGVLGMVSGVLGSFAVLRKQSLVGDALSHAALPGVGIAFLIAGRQMGFLLIGAGVAGWLGVMFIRAVTDTTRIKQDTAMGIVLAAWFAGGIAIIAAIQNRPDAGQAGLDSFIFGQAAAMVESDVWLITLVGAVAFVVVALFWKQFKLVTFDYDFAQANGFTVRLWTSLLSVLVVVAVVLGLQLAGVVLMVGLLIAPGVAARQWTNKLLSMVVLAGILGAVAGAVGAMLSAIAADVPTGPTIIVVIMAFVMVSMTFGPERGVLWTVLRRRRDRRRFAATAMRRTIYHYATDHNDVASAVPDDFLVGVAGRTARRGLKSLHADGEVYGEEAHVERESEAVAGSGILGKEQQTHWHLTERGVARAEKDIENLELWELYRTHGSRLGLPKVAADRHEDIRSVLPAEAIEALEKQDAGTGAPDGNN